MTIAAKKQSKRQDSTRTPKAKQTSLERRRIRRDIRVLGHRGL